ncbi:MAG: 30S ribosomal protein S21 [Anaerolineae bacterium]|nr:30S ribosomal protein S21 [Anaerolineae bacterium]
MPTVVVRDDESQQKLFSRFRKKVMLSGNLAQLRKKRWFMPKSELNRIDKKNAQRKMRKNQRYSDN